MSAIASTSTLPPLHQVQQTRDDLQPTILSPRRQDMHDRPSSVERMASTDQTIPLLRLRTGPNPSVMRIPRPATSPDVFGPEPILSRSQPRAVIAPPVDAAYTVSVSGPSALTARSAPLRGLSHANRRPIPVKAMDVFSADTDTISAAPPRHMNLNRRVPNDIRVDETKRHRERDSVIEPNKRPRLEQHAEAKSAHQQADVKWREKWLRMFPTLRFYFEAGTEDAASRQMRTRVLSMGAHVDQFFSNKVTHLVTRAHTTSPQKPKPLTQKLLNTPRNPFVDKTGLTDDLVAKAESMKIKVWPAKKLADLLARIAPIHPVAALPPTKESLHTLLEDERIHGTRERDANAPRTDFYYFKPGSKFLLLEDATARHKPIMAKEYEMLDRKPKDGSEWPALHETFLRISSQNQTGLHTSKLRERAWALYVDQEPFEGEGPPAELRQSSSMRELPETPTLPSAQPYAQASGNSVVITSNVTSTSCANPSPFAAQLGIPGFGGGRDRALVQMSKRIQVLKGNARLLASKTPQPETHFVVPQRRASTGMPPPEKSFMTQDQVIHMLRQAREPKREEMTWEQRRANREKVYGRQAIKDQDKSSGYCENCRVRFNNLQQHLKTKKHRRFARSAENFQSLDVLLEDIRRPPNPANHESCFSPCHVEHSHDEFCEACENFSEEVNHLTVMRALAVSTDLGLMTMAALGSL